MILANAFVDTLAKTVGAKPLAYVITAADSPRFGV